MVSLLFSADCGREIVHLRQRIGVANLDPLLFRFSGSGGRPLTELACDESTDGVILRVKAHAGARRNGITGTFGGALRIAVTQAAEKRKANTAIIQVLADALGIGASHIELLSGQTSNQKRILIRGVSSTQVLAPLNRILGDRPGNS